ncbi:MAG: HlyD family efflux transporter periplasmic adaptor subunit [Aquimonas sp.]|jgi:HlyD family secretion protein|nr:HlyD family efflux transporter periplasmic adaptor subunit [Xanthomonadales bacterium]MCC6506036.1 HlyD family efflux transporter periplasmic adaptor subunit [Aquimonas sp.]
MIRDTSAQDKLMPAGGIRQRMLARAPWWVALGLVLLVAVWAVLRWSAADRSVDMQRLRIAEVTRGTLIRDAAVEGRLVAAVSPTLYASSAGTVSLQVQAGAAVKRGDVLLVVDSPELSNELARESATLASLDAEVGRQRIVADKARLSARKTQDEAEVTLLGAQRDLQRSERGYALGAISEIDVLRARDAARTAEIRREHAQAEAALESQSVRFDLATHVQALERQRLLVANLQRRVEELSVVSPVDGMVGTVAVIDRAVVAINAPLVTVVDLSRLQVELEVAQSYADDIGIGMPVQVQFGSAEAAMHVVAISPEVIENRVRVRVDFDAAAPSGLRQNQRVNGRLQFETRDNVLLLARGPFIEADGGRVAWVVRDDIATRQTIQLGVSSTTAVEVLQGLQAGDRVVIAGTDLFSDAERVRLR